MVNVTPEQVLTETVRHVALKLVIPVKQPLTLLVLRQDTSLPKRVIVEQHKYLSKVTLVEVVRH